MTSKGADAAAVATAAVENKSLGGASPDNGVGSATPAPINEDEISNPSSSCEMCANYETNLTRLQENERDLREQLTAAHELAGRYEKELSGERLYRKELELKLNALSINTEQRVQLFVETNAGYEERLQLLASKQEADMGVIQQELKSAQEQCRAAEKHFNELNQRYSKLLGLHRQRAAEMREQDIELPQTVDQLQFMALQLREELIETRSAYEHSIDECKSHKAELEIANEYLVEMQMSQQETEVELLAVQTQQQERRERRKASSSPQADSSRSQNSPSLRHRNSPAEGEVPNYREVIAELEAQLASTQRERNALDASLSEYRQKCAQLQEQLGTTEAVQKDFVTLSQKLQIQLEKIRQAEQEVRWQFDEDVSKCNQCEVGFVGKRAPAKSHCLHCGRIFCHDCLSHTIASGPSRRPARVCDVCHTLLNRESVPFFSHQSHRTPANSNNSASTN